MENNANIIFNLKQTADGNTDSSELFTKGGYTQMDGSYYIDYDETEATGYEGSHVQLQVSDNVVTMTRTGMNFSNLIFENGKRHYCHYGTEFGECMVGISTTEMKNELSADGGKIYVKYTIDVNAGLMLTNEITIKVRA